MAENDPASAVESFRQVTKLTPADPQGFNDYGASLAALSVASRDNATAERALAAFDAALQRDGRNSEALFNKALVLDFLGHQREACDALRLFLDVERDPQWKAEARTRLLC
jgi:tetratricopeptide (TPR) repeat protein